MKMSLKNKPLAYFSSRSILLAGCVVTITVMIAIAGAFRKEVTILDSIGKKKIVTTYKAKVGDVLRQNNIVLDSKDKIDPSLESDVNDGMVINIKRAVPVIVLVDGKKLQLLTSEETVEDMLKAEGITYNEKDVIYPELDTIISSDMTVRVARVTEKEIYEKQKLAYSKEIKEMPEWERGIEKVLRNGSDGEKLTTIKITYEDGIEKKREIVDEKILKPVVNSLIAVGTMDHKVLSRGDTIYFSKMMLMKATSYTDDIACTGKEGGNTATGVKPRRYSDGSKWSTVAVDPRIIPLGTKLWIEGYGYAIAEDVGGAVKGKIIDLFFNNGTAEYENWKTRMVRVYILK